MTFEPVDADQVGLGLLVGDGQVTRLSYAVQTGRLSLDRTRSGQTGFEATFAAVDSVYLPLHQGALQLQVFVDRASVEVFAQGGLVCLIDQIFGEDDSTGLATFSVCGMTRVKAFELMPLTKMNGLHEPLD